MKTPSDSRDETPKLDEVLARYNDEAATHDRDSVQLGLLRERYFGDYLELAPHLNSYFQNEDAAQGRFDCVYAAPPESERYTDVTRLGEGGQAVVYKAFDQQLQTWVALKVSKSGTQATAAEANRFLFDAQSMAQLSHPNVARVFDVKDYKGRQFISMEFIPGGSLETHLDRFIDDPRSGARLMVSVSRAVHYSHQQLILHRDLKPSNILLDTDEAGSDRPYVSDFGLAKPIDARALRHEGAGGSDPDITAYGSVVGTASYMSPEQATGKDVTTLSDVYGIGTIVYALQTGEAPFWGETLNETLHLVSDPMEKPRPPRELNPAIDPTFEAICMKCLEKNPRNRYRSAEGVAKDIDRWLAHMPTEAKPPKTGERVKLWCLRNPVGVGLAAVLVALMALVGVNVADRLGEPGRAQATLARQQAETLEIRLQQFSQAVISVARDPEVGALLVQQEPLALQEFMMESGNSRVDLNGSSPFESWFVIDDRNGAIVARWPEMSPDTDGVDFSKRDYYEGLSEAEIVDSTYVSQTFRALSDELYKFAVSAWVRHQGKNVGVVVATVTTSQQMGLPGIEEPGFVTTLLAPRDAFLVPGETGTPPAGASDFMVLLHPGYERGIDPVWFPESYLAAMDGGSTGEYRDPVASLNERTAGEYGGRWFASFAPVADSEFVVLVQQEYAPVVPVEFWLILGALLAAVLTALVIRNLRSPRATPASV